MRKIISILVALGVILGLTLVAAPVAAQAPCVCPTTMSTFDMIDLYLASPPDWCAGERSDYLLGSVTNIVLPISLVVGTDYLSVDFPADTDLSQVTAGDVSVISFWGGGPFSPATITKSGQHLEFRVPVGFLGFGPVMPAGDLLEIQVDKVINPTVAGTYCLYIDYMESCGGGACVPTQFACEEYTVIPYHCELDFVFDFGPTYPGIAEGFIPPFKACGQDGYGTSLPVGWVTDFDTYIFPVVPGCYPVCLSAKWYFKVTKCPAGEEIYFDDGFNLPWTLDELDIGVEHVIVDPLAIPTPCATLGPYAMQIHFSSPGDYEICFYLYCPAPTCAVAPGIIADECLPAKVYQYKDAWKCEFDQKWNLWSLPLYPFDTDIDSIFAAMDRPDQLKSVWYFGQCEDDDPGEGVWHSELYNPLTGTFNPGDMEIQAGKAYWVRMLHDGETDYDAGAFPVNLWLFGTHAIMPEPPGVDPGYFYVCEGWNMVGFKPEWDVTVDAIPDWPKPEIDNTFAPGGYLWNFNCGPFDTKYGLIYEWVPLPVPGNWATHLPGTLMMQPCDGYWIPFDGNDQIYPKA